MTLHKPFDYDEWHRQYILTLNRVVDMYKSNPYLTISDVYPLIQILEKQIARLDERYQLRQRIAEINTQNSNNEKSVE